MQKMKGGTRLLHSTLYIFLHVPGIINSLKTYKCNHTAMNVCGPHQSGAAQTVVVKDLKSVSHLCNKRLTLPSCQSREVQPARFLSPDKNTFLWVQEQAAWPQLKTFPDGGGGSFSFWTETVLSEIHRTFVVFG